MFLDKVVILKRGIIVHIPWALFESEGRELYPIRKKINFHFLYLLAVLQTIEHLLNDEKVNFPTFF